MLLAEICCGSDKVARVEWDDVACTSILLLRSCAGDAGSAFRLKPLLPPLVHSGTQVFVMGGLSSRNKCNTCYGVVAMGQSYCQLSLEERIEIYRLHAAGSRCK